MWEQQLWLLRWAQPSFPPSCSLAQPSAAQPCPFPGLMSTLTSPDVSKECLDVEVGIGHLMILESCSNPSDSGILGFFCSAGWYWLVSPRLCLLCCHCCFPGSRWLSPLQCHQLLSWTPDLLHWPRSHKTPEIMCHPSALRLERGISGFYLKCGVLSQGCSVWQPVHSS